VTSEPDDGKHVGLIDKGQATGVGVSALFSAAVSYVVLVIAAHTLPPNDNAIFLAYWALLFGTFGVLTGLNSEAARASFMGERTCAPRYPVLVPVAIACATFACALLGASGFGWANRVLDGEHAWLVGIVVAAGIAFSGHLAVTGVLAGRGQWHGLILATVCEASVRMACVVLALLAFDTLVGMALASAVSAAAWLLLLGRRDVRKAMRARGDALLRRQIGNFAHACAASASSAALIVGFPVLIRLTTDSTTYLESAGLLLAIALTRAPLMVPLNAYQGVALNYFLRHRHEGVRALWPIIGAVLGVTAVAASAAAVVGPTIFSLLLGGRYSVGAWLLAGLTVGAGLLALVTVTGACCLAVGGHRTYAVGWLVATVVAVLVLMLPVDLQVRTVLSLLVAPLCGASVHVVSIRSATGRAVDPVTGARRETS